MNAGASNLIMKLFLYKKEKKKNNIHIILTDLCGTNDVTIKFGHIGIFDDGKNFAEIQQFLLFLCIVDW